MDTVDVLIYLDFKESKYMKVTKLINSKIDNGQRRHKFITS